MKQKICQLADNEKKSQNLPSRQNKKITQKVRFLGGGLREGKESHLKFEYWWEFEG